MAKKADHLKPHHFKKGQSGNPAGAAAHNPEIKKLKALTESELVEVGTLVVKGDVDNLRAIVKDPKSTAISAMMASVAIRAIAKGDSKALETLLCRLIGKVPDKVHVSGANGGPQVIVTMPSNGREVKTG